MGSPKVFCRFTLVFGFIAFAGCAGDGPAGITDPPGDDLPVDTAAANAAARNAATNSVLAQMDDAINAIGEALANGGVPSYAPPPMRGGASLAATLAKAPPPPPPDAAKCTFDEANVRHVCPDFTQQNGMVIKTWFQFLDAAGQAHRHPDTAKTVAIRRFVGKRGTVTAQHTSQAGTVPATAAVESVDTLMLSGLKGLPENRRLDTRGLMTVHLEPEGQPSVDIEAPITGEGLKFIPPAPPGAPKAPPYPIAGKVTTIMKAKRADQPQGSTTNQVTTYEGKMAKLVISTLAGQVLQTCTWDMSVPGPPACTRP